MININDQTELVLDNKNKFIRLIKFIKNRLFNIKDRAKYREFSKDLYEQQQAYDLGKEKDDYDLLKVKSIIKLY